MRQLIAWKTRAAPGAPPEPVTLDGFTARAQFRVNGQVELTLASQAAQDVDGTITVGEDDGTLLLLADADATRRVPAGSGAWSIEVGPVGGDRLALLEGRLTVLEEITV